MQPLIKAAIDEILNEDRSVQHYRDLSNFCRPALEFEEASGLTGIGQHYRMPDGKTDAELTRDLVEIRARHDTIQGFAGIAAALPDLSPQTISSHVKSAHAAMADAERRHFALTDKEGRGESVAVQEITEASVRHARLHHAFETATGFQETMKKYPAITADGLCEAAEQIPSYPEAMRKAYDQLEALNPELRTLKFDRKDMRKLTDVVWGVTSAFNLDDIRSYSLEGKTGYVARENAEYVSKSAEVEKLSGAKMFWVPSIPTLDKAFAQLKARDTEKNKPAASFAERVVKGHGHGYSHHVR